MDTVEAIEKRVRDDVRKEILEQVSYALVHCMYPFGCDPACPFSKEAAKFVHPIAYCMPIMAGRLDYVRGTLEDEA